MRVSTKAIVSVIVGILSLGSAGSVAALTFNNGGANCSVAETAPLRAAFSVNGNRATTTLDVDGPASCRETVSLASWNAAYGTAALRPFHTQRFHTGVTYTLGVGQHTLSVPIDSNCSYQVDAVLGANQKGAAGDANYEPAVMMGFLMVEGNVCQPPQATAPTSTPTPTPTPPAPTPPSISYCSGNVSNASAGSNSAQGGNCSSNTTIVEAPASPTNGGMGAGSETSASASSSTPATTSEAAVETAVAPAAPAAPAATVTNAPAATPASLVNTGPGSVIAVFLAASGLGYFAYRKMLTRFTS